jgi:hypothetical protein
MSFFAQGVDWTQAACRGMDVEDFYFTETKRIPITEKIEANSKVRPVCLQCPIWEKCLTYAFRNEEFGFWGGLSAMERDSFINGSLHEVKAELLWALVEYGITEEMIRSLM